MKSNEPINQVLILIKRIFHFLRVMDFFSPCELNYMFINVEHNTRIPITNGYLNANLGLVVYFLLYVFILIEVLHVFIIYLFRCAIVS